MVLVSAPYAHGAHAPKIPEDEGIKVSSELLLLEHGKRANSKVCV